MCLYLLLEQVPIIFILIYATLRGMINATETPIRQVRLPDLSVHLNTRQAVSYHSFIINICRSIGPKNCRIDTQFTMHRLLSSAINVTSLSFYVYTINLQDSW